MLFLGIPAAYSLCRFRFGGRGPYMIFLLFTQMFPPVVMILGIFRLVAAYGLVDNLAVVAVIAGLVQPGVLHLAADRLFLGHPAGDRGGRDDGRPLAARAP